MTTDSIHILLYHEVCATNLERQTLSNPLYTTSISRLTEHLMYLQRSGFIGIRLGEFLGAGNHGRNRPGKKYFILTFDGPHAGWFDYVIPLLRDMEIPATFFVTAGWVGQGHPYPESRNLSWSHISGIEHITASSERQLFDVGSHSMWHTPLHRQVSETSSSFASRLMEEIVTATHMIRQHTGLPVLSYAPPKGIGDMNVLRPFFDMARITMVRWASLPGRINHFDDNLLDLQICYCDNSSHTDKKLAIVLSPPWLSRWHTLMKKLPLRLLQR